MSEYDPPEPPDPGERLNAKNLKGAYLVLRPTELGYWPAKDETPEERDPQGNVTRKAMKAQGPQPYVACDVWVFDRAGVLNSDTGIRFTWWRAVEQLKERIGVFTMCRPVEQEDRSVVLNALTGQARETAEKIIAEIKAGGHAPVEPEPETEPATDFHDGEEPF